MLTAYFPGRRVQEYLLNTNVQLGASYAVGQKSTTRYTEGYAAAAKFINASPEEIGAYAYFSSLFGGDC